MPSRCLTAFIVGPLGLSSPRLRSRRLAVPGPAVLRIATTTFVRPGWFAFGSLPVPWVDALVFVFRPARAEAGSFAVRIQRQTPGCWLRRSPVFRRCLPRRREVLPSSRITPLNACPDLRSRWCPSPLALTRTGLLPSHGLQGSAFGPVARTYPMTTTIHFSGFNSAACVLASPLLRTPPLGDRTSVRLLTRWLVFGQVGLIGTRRRTHWVTLTYFKGCHPYSDVPSFSRHERPPVKLVKPVTGGISREKAQETQNSERSFLCLLRLLAGKLPGPFLYSHGSCQWSVVLWSRCPLSSPSVLALSGFRFQPSAFSSAFPPRFLQETAETAEKRQTSNIQHRTPNTEHRRENRTTGLQDQEKASGTKIFTGDRRDRREKTNIEHRTSNTEHRRENRTTGPRDHGQWTVLTILSLSFSVSSAISC